MNDAKRDIDRIEVPAHLTREKLYEILFFDDEDATESERDIKKAETPPRGKDRASAGRNNMASV